GRLPDARAAGRLGFAADGQRIALVGSFAPSLAASELSKLHGEPLPDALGELDLDAAAAAIAAVRQAVREGAPPSAHGIAEGGLAVALAECCIAAGRGARVVLDPPGPAAEMLFGECSGCFVVSGDPGALDELSASVPVLNLGSVGGEELAIEIARGDELAVS